MQNTRCFFLCGFWLAAALGCSDDAGDDGGNDAGVRPAEGLDECVVKIDGFHYVGVLLALSGAAQDYGNSGLNGATLAITEINRAGGIDGKPFGLVACDSKTDENEARTRMQELLGVTPMGAVIGVDASAATLNVVDLAKSGKKVLVSPASTSPALTTVDDGGYFFRTILSDALQGKVAAQVAIEASYQKVFIIHRNDAYGNGLWEGFKTAFEDTAAGRVTDDVTYEDTEVNYDVRVLDAAEASNPDAAFIVPFQEDGIKILKQAATRNWTAADWLLCEVFRSQQIIEGMGSQSSYIMGATGVAPMSPAGPLMTAFMESYTATFGASAPVNVAAQAYDAAHIVAMAMALTEDPSNGEQIKEKMASTTGGATTFQPGQWKAAMEAVAAGETQLEYEGASGPCDLDTNGDITTSQVEQWRFENQGIATTKCWDPESLTSHDCR